MTLDVLEINQFRNIAHATLQLSPQLTLLVGTNGQGKTNLLEAMYLLLQGHDFRTHSEREVIQSEQQWASIQASGEFLAHRQLWQHRVQQQPLRRFHQGIIIPVVLFSPEDVYLAKGSPERRRRFLDLLLSAHDPHYARSLKMFNRLLLQRNRALKEAPYQSIVDDFTPMMIHEGLYIWKRRLETIHALQPRAARIHQEVAVHEQLYFELKLGGTPHIVVSEEDYQQAIESRRSEERARQTTLVGPHRDDIMVNINGMDTTIYASQGQLRTVALSLKLATYDWLFDETGMKPIIFLDDVLSELDAIRREAILRTVAHPDQQTIVTDTEPRSYRALEPTILHVNHGEVKPWIQSNNGD